MNSIFRKTLIATFLSATLGSVAIAADDYKDTLDGSTADNDQLNTQPNDKSVLAHDNRLNKSNEGKGPCKDHMNIAGKSGNRDQRDYGSEDRPLSDHQGNVTDDMENTTGKSGNHAQEDHGSENRPLTDHQDNVTDEVENATRGSANRDQRDYGSEDRPLSDHQGNVTDDMENTTGKSGNHAQEDHGSENRPLTDHQDNVTEEEEEEEEISFRLNGKTMNSSEMDVQVKKYLNSYITAHQDMTSYISHVSSR